MFILGSFSSAPDEILLEVIRIFCTEMNREDISKGFHSHTEEAGRRVMEYLWKIGVLEIVKDEPKQQMTLDDFMRENSDGKHGMGKGI